MLSWLMHEPHGGSCGWDQARNCSEDESAGSICSSFSGIWRNASNNMCIGHLIGPSPREGDLTGLQRDEIRRASHRPWRNQHRFTTDAIEWAGSGLRLQESRRCALPMTARQEGQERLTTTPRPRRDFYGKGLSGPRCHSRATARRWPPDAARGASAQQHHRTAIARGVFASVISLIAPSGMFSVK